LSPILSGGIQLVSPEGSVTRFLAQLQEGDPAAVQPLWERYFPRLVALARLKLRNTPRQAADEEDVALSAFDSFCRNAEQGRFPRLLDRDSLWQLLVVITIRKAAHLLRDQARQKRGGGIALVSGGPGDPDEGPVLEQVLSKEPSPEMAAQMAEECQRLLRVLGDHILETVAVARMEGCSVEEIATRLDCAPRSVKRKLQLIRKLWEKEVTP
jgi:DNA-directed RNA polymerase specialized sigma24 family protein